MLGVHGTRLAGTPGQADGVQRELPVRRRPQPTVRHRAPRLSPPRQAHAATAETQTSKRAALAFAPASGSDLDGAALLAALAEVTTPVLVLGGERDALTGVAAVHAVAASFPHATATVLPRAGHFPWVDEPEAFATAARAGVPGRKLFEVLAAGPNNSGILQMAAGRMLEGDLTGLKFTLVNAMKDLRYYTHLAESLPTSAVVGEAVHQSLVTANALGFGDSYVPSLIEAQEKLAGVSIVPLPGIDWVTDVAVLLKSCDAFVLVAHAEGSPVAMLEAMATGFTDDLVAEIEHSLGYVRIQLALLEVRVSDCVLQITSTNLLTTRIHRIDRIRI